MYMYMCIFKYYFYFIFSYYRELTEGIPVFDENGNRLGNSTKAASKAIGQVVFSRIAMATPGMSEFSLL